MRIFGIAAWLSVSTGFGAALGAQATRVEPPPPRSPQEVQAVLGQPKALASDARLLHIVLVAGPKDHGPGEHDYPGWQEQWGDLLRRTPRVEVATSFGRPGPKLWDWADLMVFYCWGPQFWDDESYKSLDKYLARGGGLAVLHSAVICATQPQKLAQRIGFAWVPEATKYRHGAHDLTFANPSDPITRGFSKLHVVDEDYWPILGKSPAARVLASTADDGGQWPMLWTCHAAKGRVFCTILGHYLWTLDDPLARVLILRGMAWAAGEPVDRFEQLATVQAAVLEQFDAQGDVGAVKHPGSSHFDAARRRWRITGSGENIWGTKDAFHFVYQKTSGDLALAASVQFLGEGKNKHRKACCMIRQGLQADSPYVDVAVHGDGLISLQYRAQSGAITQEIQSPIRAPARVRLERRGDHFTLQVAPAGESFRAVGTVTTPLRDPVYAGLAVSSHEADLSETAVFNDVTCVHFVQ